MTAPALHPKGADRSENELLAQLGLPPSASPEDVDELHLAVSQFLSAAPEGIRGWAHAQAAALDNAYLTLTDPAGLQGSALRSPDGPPAVVPGGPATPPARRDTAFMAVPAAVVDADDELEAIDALDAPASDADTDMDDLQALYASVTPSAHPDMGASAPSAKAKAKAAKRARAQAAATPAAARSDRLTGRSWKKVGGAVAAIAIVAVVGITAFNAGGAGAAPAASTDPNSAAATQAAPAVDQAKLNTLMAKLQANPKDVETLMAVATEFYAGEQYTEAGGFLDKVLAIDPANIKALLAKGAVAFNTGDNAAAKASWQKVIAIEPDNQEVHYDLGFMYLNQTNPDWAGVQTEWQKVVDIDPASDLAQTVKSHLDALAKASMLPGSGPAASGSPATSGSPAVASPATSPAASTAP
ncbi:MAG TPA: hypothetical protein VGK16_05115 [Candidatus Limnocylindrales bacterium]|jgi:tetratricopeptide (TPR) repeat protein